MSKDKSLAPFLPRFSSVLIDFSIAYLCYNYFYTFGNFYKLFSDSSLFLQEMLGGFSFYYSAFLLVYIIYFIVRFYTVILFGLSFGQIISGITVKEKGLRKRIKSSIRTFIEIFTTPFFFLFDINILRSHRSFKEKLSASRLLFSNSIVKKALLILYIPCAFIIFLFAPLLQNINELDGYEVAKLSPLKQKLNKNVDFSKFRMIPSNHFSLSSFTSMLEDKIIIIPGYSFEKMGSIKKINPEINFFDTDRNQNVQLLVIDKYSLRQVLELAAYANPFFSISYPAISDFLETDSVNYIPKVSNGKDLEKFLSQEQEEEILQIVRASFSLGLNNIFAHSLNFGPFIKGNLIFRNFFLSRLDSTNKSDFSLLQVGNYNFLMAKEMDGDLKFRYYFFTLSSENGKVYRFSCQGNECEDSILMVIRNFFGEVEFFNDYQKVFKFDIFQKDRADLFVYDFLSNNNFEKIDKEKKLKLLVSSLQEIYRKCKTIDELKDLCSQKLSTLIAVMDLFNKKYGLIWTKKDKEKVEKIFKD